MENVKPNARDSKLKLRLQRLLFARGFRVNKRKVTNEKYAREDTGPNYPVVPVAHIHVYFSLLAQVRF